MDLRAVGEVLEEVDRHTDTDDPCMVLGVLGHGFPCFLKKHYSMEYIGRVAGENGVCQAGIFPGLYPVGLSSHWWKGCRGGVWPTPGQHGHQTVVAKRTDEAVERHGGEMGEHGAQLQTEPAMRGQ